MNARAIPTGFGIREAGFTLTELMVALVLGALVVLAATSMVVTSRDTYRSQDESTRVAENERFALELVNRMVRLAGYTDFGDGTVPPPSYTPDPTWSNSSFLASIVANGPNLVGTDNSYRYGSGAAAINSSDSLTIRYYGSGASGGPADGNILDCAGVAVPAPALTAATYLSSRDFNVLFVDYDVDGEPSLKCGRYTFDPATGAITGTDIETLIRGVETFQVLYGEATYLNNAATPCVEIVGGDPDINLPLTLVYRTGIGGGNPVVCWNHVRSVRIAMLLRSNVGAQADSTAMTYKLFGPTYAGAGDPGATFSTSGLSTSERTRIRRVVSTTVFVRNRMSPWPGL